MQYFKMFILLMAIVILLCSCSNSTINNNESSHNTTQPTDNIVMKECKYTDDQLNSIINFSGNLNELLDSFHPDYNQNIENGFRTVYYGKKHVAIVLFDLNGNKTFSHKYSCDFPKESYEHLQIGNSIDMVRSIDPNGEYLFLFTGRNDIPKKSTHCTSDGYYYTITYDENNMITDIFSESLKID